MATVTLHGTPFETVGELPAVGSTAPDFKLTGIDMSEVNKADYAGKKLVLNIFPSVDTPVCAKSIRHFNEALSELDNTTVLCISADLPFAQKRFCGAEGLDNVINLSTFRSDFGNKYGVAFKTGPLAGLMSRSVVVLDAEGVVLYTQQVSETGDEPDYEAAMAALKK